MGRTKSKRNSSVSNKNLEEDKTAEDALAETEASDPTGVDAGQTKGSPIGVDVEQSEGSPMGVYVERTEGLSHRENKVTTSNDEAKNEDEEIKDGGGNANVVDNNDETTMKTEINGSNSIEEEEEEEEMSDITPEEEEEEEEEEEDDDEETSEEENHLNDSCEDGDSEEDATEADDVFAANAKGKEVALGESGKAEECFDEKMEKSKEKSRKRKVTENAIDEEEKDNGAKKNKKNAKVDGGKAEEHNAERLEVGLKERARKSRQRSRKKVEEGSSKKVVSAAEDKLGSSTKKKSKKRAESMGMIFMCSSRTKNDCYNYRILGLPASKRDAVEKIYKGMRLFLYDVDLKLLYGIYKAAGPGGYNIEPKAFKSQFPAQVRFTVLEDCLPLAEEKFKKIIKDNYYTKSKFDCQLTSIQVKKLCKLFEAASKGSQSKKVGRSRKAENHTPVRRDRNRRRRGDDERRSALGEARRYHERPSKHRRHAATSPVAPPRRILPLPAPAPPAVPSYAYGRTSEVGVYRLDPYLDNPEPYRNGRDTYFERRDPYRDGRDPYVERRDLYRDDPHSGPRDTYRREPILEHPDVYRQQRLVDYHDSYRRDELLERRDIQSSNMATRQSDEIGIRNPYVLYQSHPSYDVPLSSTERHPRADLAPEYRPVSLLTDYHSTRGTLSDYRSGGTLSRY